MKVKDWFGDNEEIIVEAGIITSFLITKALAVGMRSVIFFIIYLYYTKRITKEQLIEYHKLYMSDEVE